MPATPPGYQVETANLYFPVIGGTIQETAAFVFKVSTSTNHDWTQNTVTPSRLPAPTTGSTQSRILNSSVLVNKPTLAPFIFTSYILEESTKTTPRATFILSSFSAEEAQIANILSSDHYIQTTKTNMGGGGQSPYLIITYSEIVNIEITGIDDGGLYNTNVTPKFNIGTATLNGTPFTSGTPVTAEGSYTLTVAAGSQSKTIQFRIDKTSPTGSVTINGGAAYTTSRVVMLDFTLGAGVTDVARLQFSNDNLTWSSEEAYIDSRSYTLPTGDGIKTVYVRFIGRAGNEGSAQASVILDTTAPIVNGVINGASYNSTRTITFNEGTATLNGSRFTSGTSVNADGSYVLIVTDGAGNVTTVTFTIDKTVPVVSGVEEGKSYNTSRTITFNEGTATLNGSPFMSGMSVSADGSYVLVVTDGAGNVTTVTFTIDKTVPVVSGVEEGKSYNSSRTITFNEGTATLNGSPFVSGTSVNADGTYVLVVTDAAGNSITITFSINKIAPIKYTVKYDGNGATGGQVPVNSQTYEDGHSVTVAGNNRNLVRTGFTFNGWNTKADGSGINYVVNNKFSINASDVTLYALWKVNRYTLSFESSGGDAVTAQSISYNATASEPTAPTKTGYTFGGWFKESAIINQWDFTKDVITANMTLYAKWIQNNSSGNNGGGYNPTPPKISIVFFETNGGNLLDNLSVTNDTRLAELPIPIKEGYTFGGWYHDEALTKKWDITKDRVSKDTKLYAKWVENKTPEPIPNPEEPNSELPVVTFDDLSGHWAKEMIEDLASQGIITGYPDGSFHPNETIKRHHMALLFIRAFEFEPIREVVSFSDVSTNHPSYEAIMSLQQAGIVDGSKGEFHPNNSLTRAEMAKIVALALGIEPGGTSTFQDVSTTHWSYAYIAALEELGIVLGDKGKFKPDEPVTRAQFVAMINRALNLTR
ncbi:InlB B-repeat-containing protein [Lysinibacillus sp. ZYM-1]|uniref:InlB B-repeat-containing protein n=1 Tax=Lysinibacillus sp. ZYM-1 TaxID=1681184 RepID=UPI0009E755FC|nr:InlB B-repeat-containing protein [Lysinibacillus sp. ZYM-1]